MNKKNRISDMVSGREKKIRSIGTGAVFAGVFFITGIAAPFLKITAYGKTIRPPQISIAMATPYDEVMVQRISEEREMDEIHIAVSLKTRTLFLCYGTQIIDRFIAQVGMNSEEGDKCFRGDKRTPRGEYYVCLKKADSQYYRALGLSYPNVKDADRGYESGLITKGERDAIAASIAQGTMPDWNTALGGYIEIHGEKGGPTEGCVAVGNPVMDCLWPVTELGCRVRIY